jgi:hypothetical protein
MVKTEIFVGLLSNFTTEKSLTQFFSKFGHIESVSLCKSQGKPPFAIISFSKNEEAQMAISEGNGESLDGRIIYVNYPKKHQNARNHRSSHTHYVSDLSNEEEMDQSFQFYICPLPDSMNKGEFCQTFKPLRLGKIFIYHHPDTHELCSFFNLMRPTQQEHFILKFNGKHILGKQIFLQNNPLEPPFLLYFKGFKSNVSQREILNFFSRYGEFNNFNFDTQKTTVSLEFQKEFSFHHCISHFDRGEVKIQNNLISISTKPFGNAFSDVNALLQPDPISPNSINLPQQSILPDSSENPDQAPINLSQHDQFHNFVGNSQSNPFQNNHISSQLKMPQNADLYSESSTSQNEPLNSQSNLIHQSDVDSSQHILPNIGENFQSNIPWNPKVITHQQIPQNDGVNFKANFTQNPYAYTHQNVPKNSFIYSHPNAVQNPDVYFQQNETQNSGLHSQQTIPQNTHAYSQPKSH